jgi:hypothetical protein
MDFANETTTDQPVEGAFVFRAARLPRRVG